MDDPARGFLRHPARIPYARLGVLHLQLFEPSASESTLHSRLLRYTVQSRAHFKHHYGRNAIDRRNPTSLRGEDETRGELGRDGQRSV